MKHIFTGLLLILSTIIFSGCIPKFLKTKTTIDLPYEKVLANITTGLEQCVQELYTYSENNISEIPPVDFYGRFHVFNKHPSKSEYHYKWRIRDAIEGDCAICMPESGIALITTKVEKVKDKTTLSSYFPEDNKRFVKGFEKWARGKLNSCYGASLLDSN